VLTEAVSLLQHQVEQQLRTEGALVTITNNGRALFDRVLPGHIQVTRLLFDPLTDDDLHHLGDIMTRVRDHMRARPPRSAAPRKHRPNPATS
jgi:hypothetical protein